VTTKKSDGYKKLCKESRARNEN